MVYYKRLKRIARIYSFDIEYITNEILDIDSVGKCFSALCKYNNKKLIS